MISLQHQIIEVIISSKHHIFFMKTPISILILLEKLFSENPTLKDRTTGPTHHRYSTMTMMGMQGLYMLFGLHYT